MARKLAPPAFSWANSQPATGRRSGPLARVLITLRETELSDVLLVLLFVGVYDGIALLALTGVQSVQCGSSCGLSSQLQLLRQAVLLVPPLLVLPPLLLAQLLRRRRLLILVSQLLLCVALTLHNASEQHTVRQRINGTVPCWNSAYTPADCPWGVR